MNPEAKWTWQYNGVTTWCNIRQWCLGNFGVFDSNGYETIYFHDEKDYAWFLLRWA